VRRLRILGIPVDAVTEAEAVAWVKAAMTQPRPRQIVTVNPEFVVRARSDRAFREVLEAADLAIPDGAGLLWAARRSKQVIPERVAGVDLIEALAGEAAGAGWRLFLLGAKPGVAEAAAAVLHRRHPRLVVCGTLAGSPSPSEDAATSAAVRAARTDLLLVAFGAPGQDLWISRNLGRCGARVAMGVGGAFDFISGQAQRAPAWMRRRGLEWLYRLGREPWRWRRMLALPRFVVLVLRGA
jgi:N-acetylglucosaminyldiphosphoundecaprenol N-acetyl-beta-D-mannosaminyltransferase